MNLVDSCGWLEYLADGSNADFFAPAIENADSLVVPTICILEVFKRIVQQRDEDSALQSVAVMNQGKVVELSTVIALRAAKLGHELKLPLADSVVLATARLHQCVLWTQDGDFKGIPNTKFIQKRERSK
jgi:toxin FitB